MLGSSLAVGAVCCARHHLAFTLRAVLRELFTVSVCVALCSPALFCAFIIPGQSSCCLPPVIVMQPRAWRVVFASGGCGRCQRRKLRPQAMHPSLHYCLRIHEHVPPLPSCAQVPFPVPSIPARPPLPTASTTAATASTTAATASTTAATGVVVAATAAAALPVTTGTAAAAALPPLLRRWQLPPTATAALPLPTSPTVVASAIVAVPPSPLPYAGTS